jgi:cytochrome d ubiquinol oxidase subunit II
MSLAAWMAFLLGFSLTAYAVLAGADFGAGILGLFASEHGDDRASIAETIGPLWEANHVWLIFSITILFSAFPPAFSALGTSLLAPLTIALLAIVLRSVALGLRTTPGVSARAKVRLDRLFGAASVVAPVAFGVAAGGLAKASTVAPAVGGSGSAIPWTSPFALVVGALAVALCAQLAATFVALRLARSGQHHAAERFRRRALQATAGVFVLMVLALVVAAATAPALWHRLTNVGLPLLIVGVTAVALALVALARRRYPVARGSAAVSAAAVLWGWFVAQAPHLVGPRLAIHTAAASHAALVAIAIAAGFVLILVLPAMYLLFTLFARPVSEAAK